MPSTDSRKILKHPPAGGLRRALALLAATFAATATVIAMTPAASAAEPASDRTAPAVLIESVAWPPADWTGWTIYHYDLTTGLVTPGLDASVPENRDAQLAFAAMGESVPASHVTCNLSVTRTSLSGGLLRASTSQHCSNVTSHRTEAQFQRRNAVNVWVSYGGWSLSSVGAGNNQALDRAWSINCGGGSSSLFRLRARPVVTSTAHGTQTLSIRNGSASSSQLSCGTSP